MQLITAEALAKDVGRGVVRVDPDVLEELDAAIGDIVEICGGRSAFARALPTHSEQRGKGLLQLDGLLRENAKCGLNQRVELSKAEAVDVARVSLKSVGRRISRREATSLSDLLDGVPVQVGDRVRATLVGNRWLEFRVEACRPEGPAIIRSNTRVSVAGTKKGGDEPSGVTYEDIGGLGRQLDRIREMIELPLRFPQLFDRLGISPPKGVLLHGPPGTGKTLIARAVAHETDAHFQSITAPEIMHMFYGASEAHLRRIFDKASKKKPSIIFIDEIDAIAPKRDRVMGETEKRVVAQLLGLMDGLEDRGEVIVIAATNRVDSIDPALRRPGRFDREISVPIPSVDGRLEIPQIHSRGMPLSGDVQLAGLADVTHGYVGADLAALCQEAAMVCLRELIPDIDLASRELTQIRLDELLVSMDHFERALTQVEPSAIREVFTESPSVSWEDVGGLEAVKARLQEAVMWPLEYRSHFEHFNLDPPRGLLLAGPPGTGKTLLAKALASESDVNFISIKGPELLSKFVGESERGVRDIFQKARAAAPCIVFIDELESLLPRRSAASFSSRVSERVVGQFLSELDGVEDVRGVYVLGATNRPELVDPAILRPGRLEMTCEVPVPDVDALRRIYEIKLRDRPTAADVNIAELARSSVGMTGADIDGICRQAALRALRRGIEGGDDGRVVPLDEGVVRHSDLVSVMSEWQPNRDEHSIPKAE